MKVAREGIGRFVRRLIVSISKDDESLFSSRIRSQKRYRIPPGLFFSFFFLNKRTLSEFNFRSYSPPFFFFFFFRFPGRIVIVQLFYRKYHSLNRFVRIAKP